MEVILNCGDKINVPNGCKAEIKDGVITIVREKVEFKDGDILISKRKTNIVIFKEQYDDYCFRSYYNSAGYEDDNDWDIEAFCPATEEEKQFLFKKMAEQGLRWNAEEKKVEKIRWRAEKEAFYYFFTTALNVAKAEEDGKEVASHRYAACNYFRTEENARKAAELVKGTLKKFHEDYGNNK
jgi:hypothetical protein|nr:MAG TPA: hypothetical protein [Caudoviricetes sp.]